MTEFAVFLEALQELPLFQLIAESSWIFPALESIHVAALGLVVGSILVVDLRLLGLSWRHDNVAKVAAELLPITWIGFAVAVLSGVLMFGSSAVRYSGNPAFLAKLLFLGLAGLNMAIFHKFVFSTVFEWGSALPTPMGARVAATFSIVFWLVILVCGRWIGFI
jgi:hypothetical protein